MHPNLNIDYKDLETIINKLPLSELKKLNTAIKNEIVTKKQVSHIDLQKLILNAPTWSEMEYADYKSARDHINKSRIA